MAAHSIGIIGYGGFGQFLHHSWQEMSDVQVIAVADQNPATKPPTGPRFYQDWHELTRDPQVEIVSIATPPSTHAEMACRAMEAGKHVLVEKPLATTVQAARKIIEVQRKTGKIAAVNYMLRFNPIIEALAELTKKKVFGELRRAAVENYAQDEVLPPEHWFWRPNISGGILIEHAVHFIDLVHYLSDQKRRWVSGACHYRNAQQEDVVIANVLYDRGLIATHYHSFTRPGFFEKTTIRLAYDLAQVDIEGWIPLQGRLQALVNTETKALLDTIPGLEITEAVDINDVKDESRPEGWGNVGSENSRPRGYVRSRGISYPVTEMVIAQFEIGKRKQQVYAESVRRVLSDLIKKIEDPSHSMRITLNDGLTSLEIAELAAACGRKNRRE
ncbi:MAG: Gfo/Idh/MocA family oxidoreductase [Firmicutes bacterium]|nr:Gfo/Idh/MocA family oxidoreductase [Bacillota bacterium]